MELPEKNLPKPRNDKSEKYLKNIQSAGQWARVLGWLGLAIMPLTGLFTSTTKDPGPTIIYVFVLPLAFYLIYAGKYVQFLGGKNVGKFLIINAIVSVCGITGLIPIITLVTSLVGYSSYKKLKKIETRIAYNPKKAKLSLTEIIIFIALVLAGSTILLYSYHSGGVHTGESTSNIATSTEIKEYNSVEHGFKVNFPGMPSVERETLQESGYSIPYTAYSKDVSGGAFYMVAVYDFTGLDLNETGALEGAINGAVQNTQGAKLISSNFTTYQGLNAIDAYYTAPSEGKVLDVYVKGFIKNGKMYALFTFSIDKSTFNNFVNSFVFTN